MTLTRTMTHLGLASSLAVVSTVALAQAGQTVKIAHIDPFSGPFANVAQNQLKSWQFIAEEFNKKNAAGVKFEIIPFDNKGSPQESLNALKAAIDQGIRYITQGNGSGAALAISDAVSKHNERNPGSEVVYLNYAAVDPDLTNSKCSYWHFRLDADTTMKLEALTSYMKEQKDISKVYLINQNYSHGQQVSRYFKEIGGRKMPNLQIVGDDLHPLGQVKDFAPYVAKIKASGADTVVTGNWGQDLTLLVKASKDAGLDVNFYTYYAGVIGTPTAMGASAEGKVFMVANWHPNVPKNSAEQHYIDFKKKFGEEYYTIATWNILHMLAKAIKETGGADPTKIAKAFAGMKMQGPTGEIEMRKTDHQLQQPIYIASWQKKDGKLVRHDSENAGFGFRNDVSLDSYVAAQPTTCNMKQPG